MHQPSRSWIEKTNFSKFCRPYGRPIGRWTLKKFCFYNSFSAELMRWLSEKFRKIICQTSNKTEFWFFLKKEYFLEFGIFSGKIMLAGQWPANSWKNKWKILAGHRPAKCSKNFLEKKIEPFFFEVNIKKKPNQIRFLTVYLLA